MVNSRLRRTYHAEVIDRYVAERRRHDEDLQRHAEELDLIRLLATTLNDGAQS